MSHKKNENKIPYLWKVNWKMTRNKDILSYDMKRCPNYFVFLKGEKLDKNLNLITYNSYFEKLDNPLGRLIFSSEVPIKRVLEFDYLSNNGSFILVGEKIIEILKRKIPEDQLQYFDSEIICPDGKVNSFKALNFLKTVDAVDYEKSIPKYMLDGKNIRGFKVLYHKPNAMGNIMLAREKDRKGNVLVHPDLVEAFKLAKIKGAEFIIPNGEQY